MIKKIIISLFSLLLVCLFQSCDSGPPPQQYQPAQQPEVKEVQPEKSVSTQQQAQTQKTKAWPFLEELGGETIAMSDNLIAKNFVLIFDGSSSMAESKCADGRSKIEVAKEAVTEWSKTLLVDANLGLVAFHKNWTVLDLGNSREKFMEAVNGIIPDNNTPLASAFKTSYGILTKQAKKQMGYGEYTIVAVTDGQDNDPRESLSQWVNYILRVSPIRIYTIGFCISGGHALNQPGRTIYKDANNPAELRQGLQEVLAEAEKFDQSSFK